MLQHRKVARGLEHAFDEDVAEAEQNAGKDVVFHEGRGRLSASGLTRKPAFERAFSFLENR